MGSFHLVITPERTKYHIILFFFFSFLFFVSLVVGWGAGRSIAFTCIHTYMFSFRTLGSNQRLLEGGELSPHFFFSSFHLLLGIVLWGKKTWHELFECIKCLLGSGYWYMYVVHTVCSVK